MKTQVTLLIAVLLGTAVFGLAGRANSLQISPFQLAQGREPVAPARTSMTPRNANQIAVQITDGEFRFGGILVRSSGNTYIAQDRQVRVVYDRKAGRVVVINIVTGTEFYNYPYRDRQRNTSEGSL